MDVFRALTLFPAAGDDPVEYTHDLDSRSNSIHLPEPAIPGRPFL